MEEGHLIKNGKIPRIFTISQEYNSANQNLDPKIRISSAKLGNFGRNEVT